MVNEFKQDRKKMKATFVKGENVYQFISTGFVARPGPVSKQLSTHAVISVLDILVLAVLIAFKTMERKTNLQCPRFSTLIFIPILDDEEPRIIFFHKLEQVVRFLLSPISIYGIVNKCCNRESVTHLRANGC